MQLHNQGNSGPRECDDAIWELIPWYVNESLSAEQAEAVKAHSKTCAACALEIGRQRQLARDVVTVDPFDVPLSRSWETLRAQIKAEERAKSPKGVWQRFGGLQGGLVGLAAAACCVVVLLSIQPAGNEFETLTSQSQAALPTIKFHLAPGVDADALNRRLATFDATLVSGPSDTGVYTASVPEGTDPQVVADALMASPDILFAAPEVDQ